tara:strand:+ start:7276 stop:7461 length:186 start_codon:yes stop_codon:yes gene_type:complete
MKCIHHWMIETANGPSSKGECNICGLSKTFDNSVPLEKELGGWKVGSADYSTQQRKESRIR